MIRIVKQAPEGISFLELLLNENLCAGTIKIEKELARQAGGINTHLKGKQKYELLLRVAKNMPILFLDEEGPPASCRLTPDDASASCCLTLDDDTPAAADFGWQTDCYIAGKYSNELRENGLFDAVLQALLEEAAVMGRQQETLAFLEQMIGQTDAYHRMDEGSQPFLVYKGDTVCHNVLNIFAEQFGLALEHAGKKVIYFDCEKEDLSSLTSYMRQHYQAVIGVQSYLFSIKMQDEIHYLHEYIYGPKYNFIFDHPIWMKPHLLHRYPDFYVLTHDENYTAFTKKYFDRDALLFPPAGMASTAPDTPERIYDLSFIGTYGSCWHELMLIHQMDRDKRFLANKFLLKMRQNPSLTSEAAFAEVLKERGMVLSDSEFLDVFYEMRRVIYCVMHYYRHQVLRTILERGIRLDVFGDSWTNCPLRCYPNLICHPNVTVEESLDIYHQSKLSLNIMSWHKGGFTERMANIMLGGAVLVTDDTTYLRSRYDENDLLVFRLEEREKLPEQIEKLLSEDNLRERMAQNGMKKTQSAHTWETRAQEFLKILQSRALPPETTD